MADGSKLLQNEVVVVQLGLPPGGTYVFHDGLQAILIRMRDTWIMPSTMLPFASCTQHPGPRHALPEDKLVHLERKSLEAHVVEQVDIVAPGLRRIRVSRSRLLRRSRSFAATNESVGEWEDAGPLVGRSKESATVKERADDE